MAKDSEKPLSTKEAVILLAPALLTKKEEGFTAAELTDFLAEHGIIVKPHNLTRYMREYSAANAKPILAIGRQADVLSPSSVEV